MGRVKAGSIKLEYDLASIEASLRLLNRFASSRRTQTRIVIYLHPDDIGAYFPDVKTEDD